MRHPRTWPVSTSVFVAITMAFLAFGLLPLSAPDEFSYWNSAFTAALALGIAFLASRICWWIFAILGATAMWLVVWTFLTKGIDGFGGWDAWVHVLLQGAAVGLVLSPAMIRWIGPIGQSAPSKVQSIVCSFAPMLAGGGLFYTAIL
jgi:hypothetical protein